MSVAPRNPFGDSPAMPLHPPAQPGMPLSAVDTPALIVDLDAFERNIRTMAGALVDKPVRLRPHAKTHKSPVIARKQMAAGAVGICCQKVSEAEIMAEGGIGDILVTNQVVGAAKLDRLAALAKHARIGVCVDHAGNVADLSRAAARIGAALDVYVEIDVGAGRCGVAPGAAAVELARAIEASPALRFAGLQAYQGGAQHIRAPEDRRAAVAAVVGAASETVAALEAAGLSCPAVTGAGTGTFPLEAASGLYTELQAGSYIFMDADYARNLDQTGKPVTQFEHALFVLATVMSAPVPDRAVTDAGLKSFSVDSGLPHPWDRPGVRYVSASDEHGTLAIEPGAGAPAHGEKLLLVPGHCDPTVNLHDWYVAIRDLHGPNATVEALWPVAARGAAF